MSVLQILAIAYLAAWVAMSATMYRTALDVDRDVIWLVASAFFGAAIAAVAMVAGGGLLLLIAIAFGWVPE